MINLKKRIGEIPREVLLGFYAAELKIPEFTLKGNDCEYACIRKDIAIQIADILKMIAEEK